MPKYRAHRASVRNHRRWSAGSALALDEQLRKSGFEKSRVVSVEIDAPARKPAERQLAVVNVPRRPVNRKLELGGLLLVAASVSPSGPGWVS